MLLSGILQSDSVMNVYILFQILLHYRFLSVSRSVVLDSLRPHGLQLTRLLSPRDFSGNDTGVGCHCLLQGISPTQGLNPGLLGCMQILYRVSYKGSPRDSYKVSSMSSVLYSRSWLFIYFVYRNGYLLIPNS